MAVESSTTTTTTKPLPEMEIRLMVTRAEGRGRGLGKSGKKAQTSGCKINKLWGCEVHKDYGSQHYRARGTAAKGAHLTSPLTRKRKTVLPREVPDVSSTYADNHFTTYPCIKSFCCAP